MSENERFLTVKDVADRLGASRWQVMRWLKEGRLKALKLSKQTYRITERDYLAFLENSRAAMETDTNVGSKNK